MLQSYLKIALRSLWKNRVYSGINVFGLAVGLATCLLIALYMADELSYDRHHQRANRIYRVVQRTRWEGGDMNVAITSAPFAPTLKQTYPEVEQAVRLLPEGGGVIQQGTRKLTADDILFADANVFEVFSYPFLFGNPKTALGKPQCIVLTKTLATRLFGNPASALGKTVLFEGDFPNLVTGVMVDVPTNSHLRFSALRSLKTGFTGGWQDADLYTYLLLKTDRSGKPTDPATLTAKFPAFFERFLKPEMGAVDYTLTLQPLTSIHLHSDLGFEPGPNGNSQTVWVFALIGGLILLLAGINYMNLATARSAIRVREVGVRKTMGSGRGQLAGLFLTETVLLTLAATVLGVLLAQLALPLFNDLTGKLLTIWRFGVGYSLLGVGLFAAITALLSGTYPALFLSNVRTVGALQGLAGSSARGTAAFRKVLVTGQFVITIALMAASGIIYQQLRFVLTKPLGFNKEQVLTFHLNSDKARAAVPALKAQLLSSPLIEGVAASGNPIGNNDLGSRGYFFEVNGKMSGSTLMTGTLLIDADFLPTTEIRLAQGRNFNAATPTDRNNAMLVNEALVRKMGWQQPLGKRVKFFTNNGPAERRVVGVVRDFHTYSLQHKIEPLALQLIPDPDEQDNIYVRIRAGQTAAALALIEKTYRQLEPGGVFAYRFLDQNFAKQYATEQKQSRLLLIFTALAIFIACLGLFGLATFMAAQRTKEIGVRKVLGASVFSVVALLNKDFLRLVLLAIVVATPLAWWAMEQWLSTFAYKITISGWVFAGAGTLAVVIALLTVSLQSIRAALMNPVKSLRSE